MMLGNRFRVFGNVLEALENLHLLQTAKNGYFYACPATKSIFDKRRFGLVRG